MVFLRIAIIGLLLFSPNLSRASVTVPWVAPTSASGWISPNTINGTLQGIVVNAASSTILGTITTSLGAGFVQSSASGLLSSAALTLGNITTALGFTPVTNARNLTVAGTANQITSSAGAQDLSADRTWTLSLPNLVIFPIAFNATYGTTTYASSTALTAGNLAATNATTTTLAATGAGIANCNGTSAVTTSSTGVFGCTAQPQGTVTSVTGTWPIISSGGATPNLTFGWATTSQPSSSNLWVSNGSNGFYGVATSSVTINAPLSGTIVGVGTGLSLSCTTASAGVTGCLSGTDYNTFAAKESALTFTTPLIRTANTINWVGLATTSQPASSNLLVSNGGAGVYGVATSTLTAGTGLSGSFTQIGSGGSISLASINAGVLGAVTNSTVPTSQATSTLYGVAPAGGYVLGWSNTTGGIAWIATSSVAGGSASTTLLSDNNTWSGIENFTKIVGHASTSPFARLSIHANPTDTIYQSLFAIGSSTASATTTHFIVNNTGASGFGTSSPYARLSVEEQNVFPFAFAVSRQGSAESFLVGGQSLNGTIAIGTTSPSATLNRVGIEQGTLFTNSFAISNQGSTSPSFLVQGVNANGKVGVGTSSPWATLSVNGSGDAYNPVIFAVGSTTSAGIPSTFLTVSAGGYVGIGTSSPGLISSQRPALTIDMTNQSTSEEGILVTGSVNDFLENNVWNRSNTANAQSCQTSTASYGTLTTGFVSMCANSASFNNPQTYNVGNAGDLNLLALGTNDFWIGNGTASKKLYLFAGGTATSSVRMTFDGGLGTAGLGTTTPRWLLQLASSTAPQLTLGDGTLTGTPFSFRAVGNNFYLATSSASTFATSTNSILSIVPGARAGLVGFGTSTPFSTVSIDASAGVKSFAIGSTTSTLAWWDILGKFNLKDIINGWTGIVTPTRAVSLSTATTTTWTASTTSTGYSPFVVMPFAGTVKATRCSTDASFLGVNLQVNGSNATPSYFVASTTVGTVAITAGNTFTAGQKVLMNFGTTTTASTLSVTCTLDVIQTS